MTRLDRDPRAASAAAEGNDGSPRRPRASPGQWAAVFCLPYLLLGVVWAFSNPPGAAPDELDHLVKAIGAGRFDIGEEYVGTGETPAQIRNDSISRSITFPAKLDPYQYNCFAADPDATADCLPEEPPGGDELIERRTKVGAYPVMAYIPIGLPTLVAQTPDQAFYLARIAGLLLSTALLYPGVRHATRYLGRRAGTGIAIALTPMAVFTAASVSTNGIEIMSAVSVAAVALVAVRQPETLARPGTLAVLAICGSALIVSRQLGIATFSLLALIALASGGWRVVWRELRRMNLALIATLIALAISAVVLLVWEWRYDNPVLTGPLFSGAALRGWLDSVWFYAESAIGLFGWLDTPMPNEFVVAWAVLVLLVGFTAVLAGRLPDAGILLVVTAAVVAVGVVTYSVVFYPVGANLQGRHLLAMFAILPMLAAVAVFELGDRARRPSIGTRLTWLVGLSVPALHVGMVYFNARRYAVGTSGPIGFLDAAVWAPPLGWAWWLVLAALAGLLMVAVLLRSGGDGVGADEPGSPSLHLASPLPPSDAVLDSTNTQRR